MSDEVVVSAVSAANVKAHVEHITTQIPSRYPRMRALVWFNKNTEGMDWIIESSRAAQAAFAAGIAAPWYAANHFAAVNASPIRPPGPR